MKKKITLIVLIVAAMIVGSVIGNEVQGIEALKWLGYSKGIGISPPFTVSIPVISFSFGFSLDVNVAQIIMAVVAVIVYPKVVKLLNA